MATFVLWIVYLLLFFSDLLVNTKKGYLVVLSLGACMNVCFVKPPLGCVSQTSMFRVWWTYFTFVN